MTTIITVEVGPTAKNEPLTNAEMDNNFISLNTDKIETSNIIAGPGVVRTQVGNDITLQVSSVAEYCKNVSGATIQKGTPVYQVGSIGQQLTVAPADASDPAKMPAIGVLNETLIADAGGTLIILGLIQGVNTSTFNQGDEVYVAPGGGYTNVKPTNNTNTLIQFLGIVNRVHASSGSGIIFGTAQALTQTTEETDEVKFAKLNVDNVEVNGNTISATTGDLNLNAVGDINVSNKRVTRLAEPIQPTDATTKEYVDAALNVNVPATNLGYTAAASNGTVTSSTGTGATLPAATTTLAGLMTGADKTKLDGIAAVAQVNIQVFDTPGASTWVKPEGAKLVQIRMIGGGGGGGSGRKSAAGTFGTGGGGGGGGAHATFLIPASSLGSTVAVTVGAGGGGGAPQTSDSTDGVSGSVGSNSAFGTFVCRGAAGGGFGRGSSAAGVGGGGTGYPSVTGISGTNGGNSPNNGDIGAPGSPNATAATGGGGGGGINTSGTPFAGGGGGNIAISFGSGQGPASGGAPGAANSNGGNGNGRTGILETGTGGGGGGASATGNGGNGGNGGLFGGGGGGGGAALNGVGDSGAGGNGGHGLVLVITYF
jgi:hypothetical protein